MPKAIIEGIYGEVGTVYLRNGVAVPDAGASAFLEDYDIRDKNENIVDLADGPVFLANLALRVNGTYTWVRLED